MPPPQTQKTPYACAHSRPFNLLLTFSLVRSRRWGRAQSAHYRTHAPKAADAIGGLTRPIAPQDRRHRRRLLIIQPFIFIPPHSPARTNGVMPCIPQHHASDPTPRLNPLPSLSCTTCARVQSDAASTPRPRSKPTRTTHRSTGCRRISDTPTPARPGFMATPNHDRRTRPCVTLDIKDREIDTQDLS